MKTKLIAIMIAGVVAISAMGGDCEEALDYEMFEHWLGVVYQLAPHYGLEMDRDTGTEEFFYLYCWQSDDHSVVHAIELAKKTWK